MAFKEVGLDSMLFGLFLLLLYALCSLPFAFLAGEVTELA
jgi:hypothetical protein